MNPFKHCQHYCCWYGGKCCGCCKKGDEVEPLQPRIIEHYVMLKYLPKKGWCGVHQLMYHWTMHIDIHNFGYEDKYCYETQSLAEGALCQWDGEGDPLGWHRHLKTGRRRNLKTGEEWIQW